MKNISAIDLLELLPERLFEGIAHETGVDYKVHKLKGKLMFNLLLYGMLDEDRMSLRTLEDTFHSSKFKFFFKIDKALKTRYNSLSDRLATMEVSYFAKTYEAVYDLFRQYYTEEEAMPYHIKRVDSTMVCEGARKLAAGMHVGCKKNGKKQIKITVSLTNGLPSSFEIFTQQAALSEDIAMPFELFKDLAPTQENVIAVFDRGLTARKVYAQLTAEHTGFVTRLKDKAVYKVLEVKEDVRGQTCGNLSLLSDEIICFKQCPDKKFRLIQAQNPDGKVLRFLTNCLDSPLAFIINTYKKRWDIEVFFRFLKQELNLAHLVSLNENGIQIILYMTMILAILLLIYKKRNQYGYKTAKRRFRIELDTYITALIVEYCGGDSSLWVFDTKQGFD